MIEIELIRDYLYEIINHKEVDEWLEPIEDEIKKLKQTINILKRYVAISKRRNEVNGNYDISCIYSFGSYKDITQKEYELLKEVFDDE